REMTQHAAPGSLHGHQFPDAPPPPKLPPPPENPPLSPPPPPHPPAPPQGSQAPRPRRERRPPPAPVRSRMTNVTMAAITAMPIDPNTTQAPAPITPAPTVDPTNLPKKRRRMPPMIGTIRNTTTSSISKENVFSGLESLEAAGFAASGSPLSTTAMILLTAAAVPCADVFLRHRR